MTYRRAAWALAVLVVVPSTADASDFSCFETVFRGLYLIIAVAIGFVCYVMTKAQRSSIARGAIWGSFAALVLMPLTIDGGNGTSTGPPLLNFISVVFGSDPVYARDSLLPMIIRAAIATPVLAAAFHFLRSPG